MFKMMSPGLLLLVFCCLIPVMACATIADDTFESGGVKIRYVVQGEGDPVILLHGYLGNLEMNWQYNGIQERLAQEYQVIAVDLRGHGGSGKPHSRLDYGFDMVKDVLRLMEHLDLEQAHLVGYSLGSTVAMKLMVSYPEKVMSVVLGGGGWTEPGNSANMDFLVLVADSLEKGQGIRPVIEHMTPEGQPLPSDEEITEIDAAITGQNDVLAIAAVFRGMRELFVAEELVVANTVPCLSVVGENDPANLVVDMLSTARPDVEVVKLEGADHMSAVYDPGFLEAIVAFLAER